MDRRYFIKVILLLFTQIKLFPKTALNSLSESYGNFKRIYSNKNLKASFYNFLKNVFNLYPEEEFHSLISDTTSQYTSDQDIYLKTQKQLSEISPWHSVFSYQLPSLRKQKDIMAKQTVELLGDNDTFDGYLEIGSSGRYLDYLEEKVSITGKRYYADGKEPGYSVTEMIDRGQIAIGAEYIPLADYKTEYSKIIPNDSLDLITIYIGFHHCPIQLRKPFISSIRDTMRTGGKLILRDHDCHSEDQKTIVALAHDVFNMGTNESWEYNQNETRNFYSLDYICDFIEKLGFRYDKRTLFQDGDPTKNALMLFTKI